MIVKIRPAALTDLDRGRKFYARQGGSLGVYFLDTLFADIDCRQEPEKTSVALR